MLHTTKHKVPHNFISLVIKMALKNPVTGTPSLNTARDAISTSSCPNIQHTRIRQQFERDTEFINLTREKLSNDWLELMKAHKLPQLQQELNETWQDLNQMLDKKANAMEILRNEYKEAEEQYERNVSAHSDLIDYLLNVYLISTKSLENAYESEVYNLLSSFYNDCQNREQIDDSNICHFNNILHARNIVAENQCDKQEKTFQNKLCLIDADTRIRNEQLYESTIEGMNKLFEEVQSFAGQTIENFKKNDREIIYQKTLKQNENDKQMLEKIEKRKTEQQNILSALQNEIQEQQIASMKQLSKLKTERNFYSDYYLQLRKKHDSDMKHDKNQLITLATVVRKVQTELKNQLKKAELILSHATACQKLQTEKEKLLFQRKWYDQPSHNYNVTNVATIESNELGKLTELNFLWYQIAIAEKDVLLLNKEFVLLQDENRELQDKVRHYCYMQQYTKALDTLQLPKEKTIGLPTQEASHMTQIKIMNKL